MVNETALFSSNEDKPPRFMHSVLIEQLKWLIRLRWFAVIGIVLTGLICTYVFPVLENVTPIYVCAVLLLLCNFVYALAVRMHGTTGGPGGILLGIVQVEMDLIILTVLIHFSGGTTNPFTFFYVFHVIIATIILPRILSFSVSISAISLFGLIAIGEMNEWFWLKHQPLRLSSVDSFWQNRVYVLGAFTAFAATVVLTQYLTRTIIARMTAKELEAARNKDVLSAIIKAMGEGLIFIKNDGKVAICNPEAKGWISTPGAESEDEHIVTSSIEEFSPDLAEHLKNLFETKDEITGSYSVVKFHLNDPNKSYIEAKSCPVMDVDGTRLGYVVVGKDLTEHKKLEQDLLERTEETAEINEMLKLSRIEMAQREKMVAIGQMASGIAHEIGNPLASLSSVAQYMYRKLTTDEQKEQMSVIGKQVDRISNILKRMLSLSRPATSEYKWADVNTIINRTLSLVRFDQRAQSVVFKNDANNKLPMVWLNPLHFEQVLLNVIINALDAIVAKKDDKENTIEITREFKDEKIKIQVIDTGIGMEPDICRRAFESFFTTKEIGKGTGLGLYISYNLISEIDGTINLESEPGKGTTVTIQIPIRPKKDLISTGQVKTESLNDKT